ncbi:hypothetical protein WDZ92_32380 [Nostoc sp. NIES-2111]
MDALVILVGVTANRQKTGSIETRFRQATPFTVVCPRLPQRLGFGICAFLLRRRLQRMSASGRFGAIHFVNFISGGYLFRRVIPECGGLPLGRVVYVRSPIQELIPPALARRLSRPGLLLVGGATMLSLADPSTLARLSWPSGGGEKGLVVEQEPSELARKLGLTRASTLPRDWDPEILLPDASDVLPLAVSHDEVYDSPELVAQASSFLARGRFDHIGRGGGPLALPTGEEGRHG